MRFLVIDDEFIALTKLVTLLSEYGECDAATCARQAIDMFTHAVNEGNPYNLISIDIDMPEVNGFQLVNMFFRQEEISHVAPAKKIIVSAASDQRNVLIAARKGCDSFLVKPVRREVLAKKLRELSLISEAQEQKILQAIQAGTPVTAGSAKADD